MMRRVGVAVLLLTAAATEHCRAQTEEPIVREIEIRFTGPETVNRAIVRANIQTTVGQPRSRDLIEQDVRTLIATGYFFDVRVLDEPVSDGVKIIYQVQGKATIKEIVFEGQKRYKEERLRREVSQKAGDILDELKIHQSAQKITEIYQKAGYADVKIEPVINIDKDTSKAIVRFKIVEGPRVFIKQIQFEGCRAISSKRLLKLMATKRKWWGSWFSGTGVLRDDEFDEDLAKVRDYYHSQGYLDMEIRESKVDRISTKYIVIRIVIFEGTQYKVGDIQIEGNTLFPTVDLERRLKMTTGHTFTPDGLTADIKAQEDYYGSRGYLDTSVRSARIPNVDTGRMDLTYSIREGELTYIEMIDIRGNTKTKDKVIRRELAVAPGDIYNTVRVERSVERLRNLNYFSKVETIPEPTPVPNRKNLVINVAEQRTGSVTFGAGFSSIDNLTGFIEVTQGNFDIFNWPAFTGGGQKLRIRAQVGTQRQDYTISFVEPWFMDQRLLLGVDAFHLISSFLSNQFVQDTTGGALRLERALSEFTRGGVEYSMKSINLDVDNTASEELQSQQGTYLRSSILFTYVYDTRNNVFLTTRGNRTELSAELVGGMLGDVNVYKLNAKTTFYFPLFHNHVLELLGATGVVQPFGATKGNGTNVTETVINTNISGGMTNTTTNFVVRLVDDVPIFDRYFLGGPNSLRGFKFRQVGPKDVDNEPVGGNTSLNGTAEYSFPIVEKVRGAVFFDIGEVKFNSYDYSLHSLKSDAGVGVRLNLPVGPLRLDYGYPIMTDKKTGQTGKIQFSVGYQF